MAREKELTLKLAEEVVEYVCEGCGYRDTDEEDVKACCPNVEEESGYECQTCTEVHADEDAARDCCLKNSKITIVCPACEEEWDVEDDDELKTAVEQARRCCNSGSEVTRYRCTECDTTYGQRDDAVDCCPAVKEEQTYECPVCMFRSKDKGKAMMHCQNKA